MIDLGWMQGRRFDAPHGRMVHDLNELYCRTKAAQAQAECHGFSGMASALAHLAAALAREPGVDPAMVRALADDPPIAPAPARQPWTGRAGRCADPVRPVRG
jgi:hypothetical protein